MNIKGSCFQQELVLKLKKYSSHTAIECGERKITYAHLERKSSFIGNWIIGNGIDQGTFIGICMDDRIDFISTIIGILMARCVFVPLDPALPAKRIENMIQFTRTRFVLCDASNKIRLLNSGNHPGSHCKIVDINELSLQTRIDSFTDKIEYNREDRIYIYFTSGTTGTPGAIIGKDKSLLHFIDWEIDTIGINEGSRTSQFINPGFDAFLRDLFVPFFAGGTLCIPGKKEIAMDGEALIDWINRKRIGLIHCVPGLFRLINRKSLTGEDFENLQYILLSGERIHPFELKNWFDIFGERIQLVNLYGTTETTMSKTCYFITPSDVDRDNIPIGKPIRGSRLIILNKNLQPCSKGIFGEIYIRTPFRTCGYYNNPRLNKERFIPNPFNGDTNDLFYRTGDLGRELPDGNMELIGRIDRQVKIRGVRVELEEIEHHLLAHKDIKEVVAIDRKDKKGNNYLCAYYVTDKELSIPALRSFLSDELPGNLLPSYFMRLEKIPLTPNGKIDKRALPEPLLDGRGYAAPRNRMEEKLIEIWSEVLEIEKNKIGIDSCFFELGGHSLKAAILVSRIHESLNYKVPLAEMFKTSTIRGLSGYIREAETKRFTSIPPIEKKEFYELSLPQKRSFFLQQIDSIGVSYNMPHILVLEGVLEKLKLELAFQELIERHESLRTSFNVIENEPVQRVYQYHDVDFKIEYLKTNPGEIEQIVKDFVRPFNLDKAPLFRAGLIKIEEAKHFLMVDMHHIISDGTSMGILVKDFTALYNGEELPPPKCQYRDFSEWQNRLIKSGKIKKQEKYWLDKFKDGVPDLKLPIDFHPGVRSFEGDMITCHLDREICQGLQRTTKETNTSVYMVLLAAYYVLLSRYTGQKDIVVGSKITGRTHPHLRNTIGMFVNMLAIRNFPAEDKSFKDFLSEVKESALSAYENQDYPFSELVSKLCPRRKNVRNPLFETVFAMQNLDIEEIKLPHLKIIHQPLAKPTQFDLHVEGIEANGTIIMNLTYCKKLFKRSTIEKISTRFQDILKQVTEDIDIKLKNISFTHNLLKIPSNIFNDDQNDFAF
jgi:amino acid adenylation domain-containing protein